MGIGIKGGESLGAVKNSNDELVTDYSGGLPVSGAHLDAVTERLEAILDGVREIVAHLREINGEDLSEGE